MSFLWEAMDKTFSGTYFRSLDAKGRLLLPPPFLRGLENGNGMSFWLTMINGRLTAYLPPHWERIVEGLCKIPMPSLNISNFKTKIIGLAQEIIPDGQGRVRIPQSLMREGGLCKEVVLVGIMDKFEIWDQASFDSIQTMDITEELASRGVEITF